MDRTVYWMLRTGTEILVPVPGPWGTALRASLVYAVDNADNWLLSAFDWGSEPE